MTVIASTPTILPTSAPVIPSGFSSTLPNVVPARGLVYAKGTVVNGVFTPSGAQGSILADAVIEERGSDEMEITTHPVEQGSTISDHAYKMPARLDVTYDWSASSAQNSSGDVNFLRKIYQNLLQLQASATLFNVYTGKRGYTNMLIRSLSITTDKTTENILDISIGLQEILMAVTTSGTSAANQATQSLPAITTPMTPQGPQQLQPATNYNAGGEIADF